MIVQKKSPAHIDIQNRRANSYEEIEFDSRIFCNYLSISILSLKYSLNLV
jgi:hypothetical protein